VRHATASALLVEIVPTATEPACHDTTGYGASLDTRLPLLYIVPGLEPVRCNGMVGSATHEARCKSALRM